MQGDSRSAREEQAEVWSALMQEHGNLFRRSIPSLSLPRLAVCSVEILPSSNCLVMREHLPLGLGSDVLAIVQLNDAATDTQGVLGG